MAGQPMNRRKEVGCSSNTMQESGSLSHFFKIICSATLEDQKLKIPAKFVKKFGDELSEFTTITVPNGRTWQLGLNKAERKISIVDGWQEFVKYHSIDSGYFLLFRYQGFSKFNVFIFDKTATEIDYPCNGISNAKQCSEDVEEEVTDDETSEQYADQPAGSRKRKKLDRSATTLKCKGTKRSENCEFEEQADRVGLGYANRSMRGKVKIENRTHRSHDLSAKHEDEDELMFITKSLYGSKRKPLMSRETERAFHAAKTCERTHPCFLVILSKANIERSYADVPSEFVVKYMQSCSDFIQVEALNGKQWQMRCTFRYSINSAKRMNHGWSAFKNDNNLKEGDVCVFELIKQNGVLLRASVYHAAEYADPVKKRLKKQV
ncbi:B3 domain-containing transcription factor VRN1 [Ziziphus jujuba]|uniref:B3 domain-containing transcription factor VRN1 n=2 Tax=Ziziphus jujuba TaxID=326968 RepID=A0ABM3IE06_ZIZJJ|nr:B3 domain-containing transcription factor VRN1 [Ziziphus jujuba]KAH7538385.1 hypothetical protein FEM48_Zijuj03G0193900 [Ziziphus jujuba var. spinosa]